MFEKVCVIQVEVQMVVSAFEDVSLVHNVHPSNGEAALAFHSDTHLSQLLLDVLILLRVAVNYFWYPQFLHILRKQSVHHSFYLKIVELCPGFIPL